ncbi:MAG: L,D-transpeptidase [Anaerolineaceae bacterium]|nr:L,D-transpeptidase [Anaerolineaceae bacterium]
MMRTKKLIMILAAGILILTSLLAVHPVFAEEAAPGTSFFDPPLCIPGYYEKSPADCLAYGASQSIKSQTETGIPYPVPPLPGIPTDPSLSELPVRIAKVEEGGALPVYPSYDAAMAGSPVMGTIQAGPMRYVTAINSANGFVQMDADKNLEISNGWVQAKLLFSWNRFQGLAFNQTPKYDFGWMVNPSPAYVGPSFARQIPGLEYQKYQSFWVFKTVNAEGYDWYLVDENTWVPSLKARKFHPDTTRPEGVKSDRWISMDLENFVLGVYDNDQLVFATLMSTGRKPYYTVSGTFQIDRIYEKVTMQDSYEADRSDYYQLQGVPWALFFHKNTAVHGVYWPSMLGFQMSHGCINLAPGDAHWLYNWAKMGDYVYVFGDNTKGDGTQ